MPEARGHAPVEHMALLWATPPPLGHAELAVARLGLIYSWQLRSKGGEVMKGYRRGKRGSRVQPSPKGKPYMQNHPKWNRDEAWEKRIQSNGGGKGGREGRGGDWAAPRRKIPAAGTVSSTIRWAASWARGEAGRQRSEGEREVATATGARLSSWPTLSAVFQFFCLVYWSDCAGKCEPSDKACALSDPHSSFLNCLSKRVPWRPRSLGKQMDQPDARTQATSG